MTERVRGGHVVAFSKELIHLCRLLCHQPTVGRVGTSSCLINAPNSTIFLLLLLMLLLLPPRASSASPKTVSVALNDPPT